MFTPLGSEFRIKVFVLMILYWPSPTKPHRVRTLPLELWAEIFEEACLSEGHTFTLYNETRDVVCSFSSELDSFIKSDSRFWTRLSITCLSTLPEIQRHVLHLHPTCPIDVSILFDLDNTWVTDPNGSVLARHIEDFDITPYLFEAIRCLIAVAQTTALWRRVCIWVTSPAFMSAVHAVLGQIPAPRLEGLFLSCPAYRFHHRSDHLFINPPPLFGGILPRLQSLRLMNASVPWGDPSYFASLFAVDFGMLPWVAWPTVDQMRSTLVVGVNITMLVFSGGGLKARVTSTPLPAFVMPSLETLSIVHWPECISILELLACGSYPRIRELTLTDFDHSAWVAMFRVGVFGKVERLTIGGGPLDLSHVSSLLQCLVNVQCFDMFRTSSVYFDALNANPTCHRYIHT
ncbi:hypothetical protein B0H19DRAFT_1074703 [Mycena capillaripes]|nr:hypothetical protein B0H19DRAFT_1074703 [Mycena capillaripes]